MSVSISTFYKLVALAKPVAFQKPWKAVMEQNGVTGTILVTPEGVNGTIAGPEAGVEAVFASMKQLPELADLTWKTSFAAASPFPKAKVKLKKEVIPLGHPTKAELSGTYVKPADWNSLIADPNVILVDTRNDYEVKIGQFEGAKNPATRTFRDLPKWLEDNLPTDKQTPIAMYCTGGIRCEKSTAYLREQGYEKVFHLEGGILKYLEDVPATQTKWQGDCYVFDDRVAVTHALEPAGGYTICPICNTPIIAADFRRGGDSPCPTCRRG